MKFRGCLEWHLQYSHDPISGLFFTHGLKFRLSIKNFYRFVRCIEVSIGVVAFTLACVGEVSAVTVSGTKHDLTGKATKPGDQGACLYCHAVHSSGDHPVGVDITADSAGIENESTITSAGLKIYNSNVECGSCHDAHGTDGYDYFLRIDPATGTLCTACHKK